MRLCAPLTLLFLVGCPAITDEEAAERLDLDGDGVSWPEDCDDARADVFPGAAEICDAVDQDCDGVVDEDAIDALTWFVDGDGDGVGDDDQPLAACSIPEGAAEVGGDCDDADERVSPELEEVCNDGLDNDCSGDANDCSWQGEVTAAEALVALDGLEANALSGWRVRTGDLDGDGAADLMVAAPQLDGGQGGMLVWMGPLDGETSDTPDVIVTESYAQSYLGMSMDPALAEGAPGGVLLGGPVTDAWATDGGHFVYMTGFEAGTELAAPYDAEGSVWGTEAYADFGMAVLSLPDLDGDGHSGVMAAAPDSNRGGTTEGTVYGFYGPLTGQRFDAAADWVGVGFAEQGNTGEALSLVGDVDGDGIQDVAIGVNGMDYGGTNVGMVTIVPADFDLAPSNLGDASIHLVGESEGGALGYAMAAPGDLDGDGLDDLAISAPADSTDYLYGGRVWVTSGELSTASPISYVATPVQAEADGSYLGFALGAPGDVDGDGVGDLMILQQGDSRVWLLHGPVTGGSVSELAGASFVDDTSASFWGLGFDGSQDLTGDGLQDLAIGAPYASTDSGTNAGRTVIFEGIGL